jgi:farnesyl-diphosphate farnesyltransferase
MLDKTDLPTQKDEAFQTKILDDVSRTFALTIPQLPDGLSRVVGNAYLLCRIADTIEDDKDMVFTRKREFSDMFIQVVANGHSAEAFAKTLAPLLSDSTPAQEKYLIEETPAVIRITHSFNDRQRAALTRCIRIMADGMSKFQEADVKNGLETQQDMDNYCYYVAGVVGEMLTDLFCDYSQTINTHYDKLMTLAVSFGQGLQMTNILKDIWDDQDRHMCWLPNEVFKQYGTDLRELTPGTSDAAVQQALGHLVSVAQHHLGNALEYTLLIPPEEKGIRRFCLWALGMAVLTLRNINQHRNFASGQEVKISRANVKTVIALSNLFTSNDYMLKKLFNYYSKPLTQNFN